MNDNRTKWAPEPLYTTISQNDDVAQQTDPKQLYGPQTELKPRQNTYILTNSLPLPPPLPHHGAYITPVHDPQDDHRGETLDNNLADNQQDNSNRRFRSRYKKILPITVLSIILNVMLVSGSIVLLTKCWKEEPPVPSTTHSPGPGAISYPPEAYQENTQICFHGDSDTACNSVNHSPRSSHWIRTKLQESSTGQTVPLCCLYNAQHFQHLVNIMKMVRLQKKTYKPNGFSTLEGKLRPFITRYCILKRTQDENDAGKAQIQMSNKTKYSGRCPTSGYNIPITVNRMYALYLYLAVNCTQHGEGVVSAGFKLNKTPIEQELTCAKGMDIMVISVFSIRQLNKGDIIQPFVSHGECVHNDEECNRLGVVML